MLERENIDNFIADDLSLRNRNWGQIEDELAEKYTKDETDGLLNEKATVTELTNGLDARYTKDETDGLLAGKADLTDSLRFKNITTNGNFSQGTTGWYGNGSLNTVSASDGVLKSTTEVVSASIYVRMIDIDALTRSSKIYVSYHIKPLRTHRPVVRIESTIFYFKQTAIKGEFNRISEILDVIPNIPDGINFYDHGFSTDVSDVGKSVEYKNIVVINLTDTFGAGNEPTVPEMNELIDILGGWFDGEITVPQKTLAIWTLNLIRQNRNAIIELGGTII